MMRHANIAYCQSVDVLLTEFTVLQHLQYACHLRLGSSVVPAEREVQCRLAAAAVGLEAVIDRWTALRRCVLASLVCAALYCTVGDGISSH